jgi:mRNA-degrading endonuclease RelE of RelBE toxin-antitoxin system
MAATQLWSPTFTQSFEALPPKARENIQRKIDFLAARLDRFPHKQVAGRPEYKLAIGRFRVLYEFDAASDRLQLHYVGPRGAVYKRD